MAHSNPNTIRIMERLHGLPEGAITTLGPERAARLVQALDAGTADPQFPRGIPTISKPSSEGRRRL